MKINHFQNYLLMSWNFIYEVILEGFEDIKRKNDFSRKMKDAIIGNQNVFIEIDGNFIL